MTRGCAGLMILIFLFGGCTRSQTERIFLASPDLFVEVEKINAHVFLAEYDFKLHLIGAGRRIASANMTGDSGGLSRIDVFRVNQNTWAFQDHGRAFCIDVKKQTIEVCGFDGLSVPGSTIKECSFRVQGLKLGYFDFDESRRWGYVAVGE